MSNNSREDLINRIAECNTVLNEIDSSNAWKVITKDLERHRQSIDGHWHLIPKDSIKLEEARVTKMAIMHLIQLKEKYMSDLENSQIELDTIDNPKEQILKDYDTE